MRWYWGAGEKSGLFFLKFDAERVNIFRVWRKRRRDGLFDEDAGPPSERNEGLIVPTSEKEGFEVEAGWLYRIQIEGIQESDCTHSWYWKP